MGGEKRSGNIKYNDKEMTGHIASEGMGSDPWRSGTRGWTISLRSHRWDISCTFTHFTRLYQYKLVWCTQSAHVLLLLSASYRVYSFNDSRCDWLSEVCSPSFDFILNQFMQTKKGISTHSKVTEQSAFMVN